MFESAQIIGLCLFTFMVLPKLPSIIHGLVLMMGVAFIPSFFKVLQVVAARELHTRKECLTVKPIGPLLTLTLAPKIVTAKPMKPIHKLDIF